MRIAICDDEKNICDTMVSYISQWTDTNQRNDNCESFNKGTELLYAFEQKHFDAVFLDIYMGDENGIDIAKQIRMMSSSCVIVFLTSSDEHYAQAFAVHAFDYLLKPVKKSEAFHMLDEMVKILPAVPSHITLSIGGTNIPVLYTDIQYVCSDSHYCRIFAGEEIVYRSSFKSIQSILCKDRRFVEINRGVIANIDYIADINESQCIMSCQKVFSVNIRKSSSILQSVINYGFNKRFHWTKEDKLD